MTNDDKRRVYAASTLAAAAAAWPTMLCTLTELTATPLERALRSAWCGAGPQAATFLGHCAACWSGSAALMIAATMVFAGARRQAGARAVRQ